MDIDDLETIVQKIASSPENRKISKMMRDNESQSAGGGLKVNKNGQFDLSNFAFGEFEPGGSVGKTLELTSEELDYKQENDDMFNDDDAEEHHRSNPYLTKNEKQKMGIEDEEENEEEENESDPSVKLDYSEQGIEITIGNTTGIIHKDEIPALYDFVKSIMDDNKEGTDE